MVDSAPSRKVYDGIGNVALINLILYRTRGDASFDHIALRTASNGLVELSQQPNKAVLAELCELEWYFAGP